jgi:hypothetical protein
MPLNLSCLNLLPVAAASLPLPCYYAPGHKSLWLSTHRHLLRAQFIAGLKTNLYTALNRTQTVLPRIIEWTRPHMATAFQSNVFLTRKMIIGSQHVTIYPLPNCCQGLQANLLSSSQYLHQLQKTWIFSNTPVRTSYLALLELLKDFISVHLLFFFNTFQCNWW